MARTDPMTTGRTELLSTIRSKFPDCPAFIRSDRAGWAIRLAAISLLFLKLCTLGLWQSERAFPHAPVWDWLPALVSPLDFILLLAEICLLGLIAISPSRNKCVGALVAIACVWIATDQIRLTPWYYLYILLLVPAVLYKRPNSEEDNAGVLLAAQVVVVGLYFWSGLHKNSYDYYHYVHGFIVKPLESYLPTTLFEVVQASGSIAPWFELSAGLLLMFGATRNLAVFLITGMHGFLLLCLGPLGSGWNWIIWPWNISMVLIVWSLFYQSKPLPWAILAKPSTRLVAFPLILLALVMPAFRFVEAWDNNLSFCLYSGKTRGLTLFVKESAAAKLPLEARELLKPSRSTAGLLYMSADTWSSEALGVPVNPEDRIYKAVGKALNERYFEPNEFVIMIKRRPGYVEEGEFYRDGDY